MIPKHIIELAIEGGCKEASVIQPEWQYLVTTPLFWQSLGKVCRQNRSGGEGLLHLESPTGVALHENIGWARYTAHRFFDLLLTSGDTAAFWKYISDKQ